jgi:hypothetical protein
MACCVAMQSLRQPFHAVFVLFCLAQDAFRLLLLGMRSSAALKPENLFLRKQLALYVERNAKPRRASDAIRRTLVLLSRLFSWRDALVNVKTETLRGILKEWVVHYNQGRPHSGLGPGLPEPSEASPVTPSHQRHHLAKDCRVVARTILGGPHHEYELEKIAA